MIDWIPVTTRVPEVGEDVIVWLGDEGCKPWDTGWYDGQHWIDTRDEWCYPTHWLPIEAPKPQHTQNSGRLMTERSEHPVERELEQIVGKTIVGAKVTDWDDKNAPDRDPTAFLLKYSDGTESYVYLNGAVTLACIDILHYPKI